MRKNNLIIYSFCLLAVISLTLFWMWPEKETVKLGGAATISFDNALSFVAGIGVTSLTQSFTVGTGDNRMLIVWVADANRDGITGVTYGGQTMTQIDKQTFCTFGEFDYMFYLANPPSGANDIVVSASPSTNVYLTAASYAGVSQVNTPDNKNKRTDCTAQTNDQIGLTPIADNTWLIMGASDDSSAMSAGTATTKRGTGNNFAMFDSNSPISPAASTSLYITTAGNNKFSMMIISLAPFSGAAAVRRNVMYFNY